LNVTWHAIKSVDPKIPVGGPATCQSQWLPETLAYAAKNNFALDFVSTHEYPTDVTPTERNTLYQVMTKARQQVGNLPLFYTEYNDGLYSPALHDDIYASAFAIFNIQDVYGIPDIMSWWTFTDIFEEGGFNSMPFQGNYGLQTIYGIPKPSFRAFEILHETGNTRAVVTTSDASSTAGISYQNIVISNNIL
jgi:xylan 1,4-beta-xylosidase